MLEWIRSVSGDPVEGGVQEALKDGRTLCKLMNCLQPGLITDVHKSKIAYLCMENLEFFLTACETLGVSRNDLFIPADLYHASNLKQVVIALAALGRCTHNADNSQSGMKVSDKFVRDHKVNQEDAAAKREELRYIDQLKKEKSAAAVAHKAATKNDRYPRGASLEENISRWLSDVLEEPVPNDADGLWSFLENGHKLIQLANTIQPGVCKHKPKKSNIMMLKLENVEAFCKAALVLGVKPSCQFRGPDLCEKKGWPKQVLLGLWNLAHSCAKVPGYTGAHM